MRPLRPGLLPVIMLVVIIAWALFAVAMLTGTLVAAQKIETRVAVINTDFPMISQELESIPLAVETGRIADEINRVAAPIGPQFTQVVDAVGSIDAAAKTVNDNVVSINGSVRMINDSVKTIAGNVGGIDTTLTAVNAQAGSINSSVREIDQSFDGILGEVRSIDDEAAGINNRADVVIGQALGINRDLDRTVPIVRDIERNSQAIADSPLLLRSLEGLLELDILKDLTAPVVEELPVPPVALPAPLGPTDGVLPQGPLLAGDKGIVPDAVPPAPVVEEGASLLEPVGKLVAPR